MRPRLTLLALCLALPQFALTPSAHAAAVVGTSQPAEALTKARVNSVLPAKERQPWLDYLDRSEKQRAADRAALAAERKGLAAIPEVPREGRGMIPLDRDPSWYASPEALHIADVIVSFQTPAGGWSKNMNMATTPRAKGQTYAANNLSHYLIPGDFDDPADHDWNYVGTLDNDATTTQLRYLAMVCAQLPAREAEPYRKSFLKGIHYLLNAQYPNGGWPQVWPLEGGYHDAITFNDNAVTQAAAVLTQLAAHRSPWACDVEHDLCAKASAAVMKSLHVILASQIKVNGKLTAWAQQHDPLTLQPVAGRNFEPAALSTGESADLLMYLMSLPAPSSGVRAAIDAGIGWLKSTAIYGYTYGGTRGDPAGRTLKPVEGAGPIWPRFISIQMGKPIFGDRDKTIHDNVSELTFERRNGYAWYSAGPKNVMDAYEKWSAEPGH
jgi:PelA/Pel-15E family pectate lyase